MHATEILFWLVILALGYICLGYPLLLALIVKVRRCGSVLGDNVSLPSMTLVIAAYNEEKAITDKIENSLQLRYPPGKLEIIVFSDGSSDRTEDIVDAYAGAGIRLVKMKGRLGKTHCQNETVKLAHGEIVVFSDANSMFEPDALIKIARHFADPTIGCVSGELRYRDADSGVRGERTYWRYESMIKRLESRLSSPVGVNGAIYAVRKELYQPLRQDALSDFITPLMIVRNGYRVVHEEQAVAWEDTAATAESEFHRRVRIVSRAVHSLIRQPDLLTLLNPFRYKFFAFQFWSHRVLRWLSGLFLLLAMVLNICLFGYGAVYKLALACQTVFYAIVLWGLAGEKMNKRTPAIAHSAYYFCLSCWAMLLGCFRGLCGAAPVTWSPLR